MVTTRLTNTAYTIGWICALEVELAAAQTLLDEDHPDLPLQPGDPNIYTLGRIASHNVVIACLPRGGSGIGSAAIAATNLLRSFPNVRFSLMVGVGGGVPCNAQSDVRLGDVVVSTPVGIYGGVVQYDMGKAIQGGPFVRTGSLNRPPDILGAAVSKLSARLRLKGSHAIREVVDEMVSTYPEAGFNYPENEHDVLFRADYLHQDTQATCAHCERNAIVERAQRTKPGNPVIHYGLIGSANQVLRDAKIRDQLGEIGILCVEMEAAGLMSSFPCLVIRGICDYCDSHKNKDWQPYAAAIASAYTKELLGSIAAVQVAQVELALEVINKKVERTADLVGKLAAHQEQSDTQAILDWLAPVDFAGIQQDHIRQRLANTGKWLFDSPEFENWIDNKNETLFLHGIPGAGKTMLSSSIVEFIQEKCFEEAKHGLGYIYLDYNRRAEQNLASLWAVLLRQILQYTSEMPEEIQILYAKCKKTSERPSLDALRKAIQSTIASLTKCYIIVDALDECQEPKSAVSDLVSGLFELQRTNSINILATSRQIPDIKAMFDSSPMLEIRAQDDDIERYIEGNIKDLPTFVMRTKNLIEEIKTEIIASANGMFLLAKLHTQSLYGKRTARELRKALTNLVKGERAYTEAYTKTMQRVCSQIQEQKDLALLVLTYVTHAKIPLEISALLHAVAIEIDETGIHEDGIPDQDSTISACCGLVVVEPGSKIVRFVHLTTQEFFSGSGADWLQDHQTILMRTCLKYLSLEEFDSGSCVDEDALLRRLNQFPFYQYASCFWGVHAVRTKDYATMALPLLKQTHQIEAMAEVYLFHAKHSRHGSPEKCDLCTFFPNLTRNYCAEEQALPIGSSVELHIIAAFGLIELLPQLLPTHDINARDMRGRTPISYATSRGQIEMVRLLVDKGAHLVQSETNSLLMEACKFNYTSLVSFLLAAGDDVNKQDYWGRTALFGAACGNHSAVASLLLDHGADYESTDKEGRTSLSCAAEENSLDFIHLLESKVVKYDVADNKGRTPLSYAVEKNRLEVARIILGKGVAIDSADMQGRTLVSWAAIAPDDHTLHLLLDVGARYDIPDNNGRLPLSYAVECKRPAAVKLLLPAPSSTVLSTDAQGMNILHWGAKCAEPATMELLLQNGSGPDCASVLDNTGKSPLFYAAARYNEEIMRMLLDHHRRILEKAQENSSDPSPTDSHSSDGTLYEPEQKANAFCTVCRESVPRSESLPTLLTDLEDMRFSNGFECFMLLVNARCHYATDRTKRVVLGSLCRHKHRNEMRQLLETGLKIGDYNVMGDPSSTEYGTDVESGDDSFIELWFSAVRAGPQQVKLLLEYSDTTRSKLANIDSDNHIDDGSRFTSAEQKELWFQTLDLHFKYQHKKEKVEAHKRREMMKKARPDT